MDDGPKNLQKKAKKPLFPEEDDDDVWGILKGGRVGPNVDPYVPPFVEPEHTASKDSLDNEMENIINRHAETQAPVELGHKSRSLSPMVFLSRAANAVMGRHPPKPIVKTAVEEEKPAADSIKISPRSMDSAESGRTSGSPPDGDKSEISTQNRTSSTRISTNEDSFLNRPQSGRHLSPFRIGSGRFSARQKAAIRLPVLMQGIHNRTVNERYEDEIAAALYSKDGEYFEDVTSIGFSMMAKRLPVLRTKMDSKFVYQEVEESLESASFTEYLARLKRSSQNEQQWEEELVKESIKTYVLRAIGKACTLPENSLYKLGEAPQRVILTERDLFYYPGMLNLAGLFDELFDPHRANGFFYQFMKTYFSGVYGPRRRDLYYIARFEEIPVEMLKDETLNASLGRGTSRDADDADDAELIEEDVKNANLLIEATRETFINPRFRDMLVLSNSKEWLGYKELDPVPKTIDDVLEATSLILCTLSASKRKNHVLDEASREEIDRKVCDPINTDHLQSFFLTYFQPNDVKILFETFLQTMKYKGAFRNHGAAFLYAAWLRAQAAVGGPDGIVTVALLQDKLSEVCAVKLKVSDLDKIHERSKNDVDTDIPEFLSCDNAHKKRINKDEIY